MSFETELSSLIQELGKHSGFPRLAEGIVRRQTLERRLDRLAALSVVQALKGFGKTTLLASWGKQRIAKSDVVVWISLPEETVEPTILLDLLYHRIMRADDPLMRENVQTSATADIARQSLADSVNLFVENRVIVIIDDVDPAHHSQLLEPLWMLLEKVPKLHVVLGTRSQLVLDRVFDSAQVDTELLSGMELSVSAYELIEFAQSWGHYITHDQALQLYDQCGGWLEIAKRVLDASLVTHTPVLANAEEFLYKTMVPWLYDMGLLRLAQGLSLAPVVQTQHLSIFRNRLEQANRSVKPHKNMGAQILPEIERLQRAGLVIMVSTDPAKPIWRFPSLIKTALADVFKAEDPAGVVKVHRLFAEALYYRDADEGLAQVLVHARMGEHWKLLSALWMKHSLGLIFRYPKQTYDAYMNLPDIASKHVPILAFPLVIMRVIGPTSDTGVALRGIPGEVGIAVESLRAMLKPNASSEEFIMIKTTEMIIHRVQGGLSDSLNVAQEIANGLAKRRQRDQVPAPVHKGWYYIQWSNSLILSGDVMGAIEASLRAFEVATDKDSEFIAALAAGHLALLQTLVGNYRETPKWLEAANAVCLPESRLEYAVTLPARITEALGAIDQLNQQQARDILDRIGDGARSVELWPFLALIDFTYLQIFGEAQAALMKLEHLRLIRASELQDDRFAARLFERCMANVLLALGELNRAERYIADSVQRYQRTVLGEFGHQLSPDKLAWLRVPYARLFLLSGDEAKALRLASAAVWKSDTVARDKCELLVIKACAALRLGEKKTAVRSFKKAVTMLNEMNSYTPYLSIPTPELTELLELTSTVLPTTVSEFIATNPGSYPANAVWINLTSRERLVLYELARESSLTAIGKTLTVSRNTVKKQVLSIYAKLDVHDRPSALLAAERLGFLPDPTTPDPKI